jgi:hypothetical protein
MRSVLVLVVAGLALGGCTNRDASEPLDAAIREHYKKFVDAELASDATAVDPLFVSDWRGLMSGQTLGLEQLREIFKRQKWERDDISVQDIRLVGPDTAVATATSSSAGTLLAGPYEGKRWEQTDFLMDVFARRDGRWVCVASHWATDPTSIKSPQ